MSRKRDWEPEALTREASRLSLSAVRPFSSDSQSTQTVHLGHVLGVRTEHDQDVFTQTSEGSKSNRAKLLLVYYPNVQDIVVS